MKKLIICLIIFGHSVLVLIAQSTTETKYFNDKYSSKEVPKEKAKYSKTIKTNVDSSITTEIKQIKTNEIIRSRTFKGKEPFGIWICDNFSSKQELDYNFKLIYADPFCQDSASNDIVNDFFVDNDSIGYKAPKISTGETSIYLAVSKIVVYPQDAVENGISGTVYLNFNITKDGKIENIAVTKGKNILLDKETVRVFRTLQFSSPAYLHGKPISICVRFPFKYTLE
jgi:TonB family protein